jgi:hypothetical protein
MGTARFQNGLTIDSGLLATGLASGDFNCDGKLDLAASTSNDVNFFATGCLHRASPSVLKRKPWARHWGLQRRWKTGCRDRR